MRDVLTQEKNYQKSKQRFQKENEKDLRTSQNELMSNLIKLDLNNMCEISISGQKLKIRPSHMKSEIKNVQNGMITLWNHLDQYHFQSLNQKLIETLQYLQNGSFHGYIQIFYNTLASNYFPTFISHLLKFWQIVRIHYNNSENQIWIQTKLKNSLDKLYCDQTLNEINLSNINKHLQISNIIHFLSSQTNDLHAFKVILKNKYIKKAKTDIQFLQNEKQSLDLFLKSLQKVDQREDQLSIEIENLKKQQNQIKQQNTKNVKKLNKIVDIETKTGQKIIVSDKQDFQIKNQKQDINQDLTNIKDFYQLVIQNLEYKQLAESISKIIDVTKKDGETNYLIDFEISIQNKENVILEKILIDLEKQRFIQNIYRENQLSSYNLIPQKGFYSFISQNLFGFKKVMTQRQRLNKNQQDLLVQWKKNQIPEIIKNKYQNLMQDFQICHHCKNFISQKQLINCNYNSQKMGLPTFNNINEPQFPQRIYHLIRLQFEYQQTQIIRNQKYSQLLCLIQLKQQINFKKGCGIYCQRKFCISCLKQNYDITVQQIRENKNWICPFCQGICYCSRCLRNDMIIKLRNQFCLLGGDPKQIQQKSIMNTFIKNNQIKKKQKNQACLEKDNQILQKKIQNIKKLKYQKMKFERVKYLSEIVGQREKFKIQKFILNIKQFDKAIERQFKDQNLKFDNGINNYLLKRKRKFMDNCQNIIEDSQPSKQIKINHDFIDSKHPQTRSFLKSKKQKFFKKYF